MYDVRRQEDAEAAGWCARLCENLRGAELFAESDGLDAFISIAMGQSVNENENGGGLMVALAQALMMNGYSDFKVAIFETLCAAAQWPSLKGRIAGSGVLGVITATLLSPRHPPSSKALMVRLCGLLATDSLEAHCWECYVQLHRCRSVVSSLMHSRHSPSNSVRDNFRDILYYIFTLLRGRVRPHQGHKHRQHTDTYAHVVVVIVVVVVVPPVK